MTTYVPTRLPVPTGLDERGLRLGLPRLPEEDLVVYRQRLLLEARSPSGASAHEYFGSVSRKVGLFDTPVADITLAVDSTAVDPVIEITASRLICWSDYRNRVAEVDALLVDRGREYFLADVATLVNGSDNFVWTWLVGDQDWTHSRKLMVGNNLRYSEFTGLPDNYVFSFPATDTGYPRDLWASNPIIFSTRVSSGDAIGASGDFAFEADEDGRLIVTTADPMRQSSLHAEWSQFPFRVRVAGVRGWAYNDPDTKYRHQSGGLDDATGMSTPMYMNQDGAVVANTVLAASPVEWGD